MDEEDGRLGPTPGHILGNVALAAPTDVTALRALQSGRADALTDASTKSLRHQQKDLRLSGAYHSGAPSIERFLLDGWESTLTGRAPHVSTFAPQEDQSKRTTNQHEVNHENVPGK